jgi:hypothetical protein
MNYVEYDASQNQQKKGGNLVPYFIGFVSYILGSLWEPKLVVT